MLSLEKQFAQAQFEAQVDSVQDVESLQMMLKGLHRLYLVHQQTVKDVMKIDLEVPQL